MHRKAWQSSNSHSLTTSMSTYPLALKAEMRPGYRATYHPSWPSSKCMTFKKTFTKEQPHINHSNSNNPETHTELCGHVMASASHQNTPWPPTKLTNISPNTRSE